MKIRIAELDEEGDTTSERVWAKKVGDDLYEVRNSPWFLQEVNFRDVVRATPPHEDGLPEFIEVVRRSGHRTIRFILADEASEKWDEVLKRLREMGVGREHAVGGLHAINLPPQLDFDMVADYLQECESKGWLQHYYADQPQSKGTDDPVH